ncbi:MAG: beta-lactamase family protein [Acidobacteria bacterium]|nr:beta-lactamase family protein [Acidobacteriota bacterium]
MSTLSLIDYVQRCIEGRLFPGCAIAAGRSSGEPFLCAAGTLTYLPHSSAVDPDTWFDLASLTKPILTATAALRAVQQRKLELETPLSRYFPNIPLPEAQVRHLLAHSSGLPAYRPFFKTCRSGEEVIDAILGTEPEYPTGTRSVYSDLGFMLLGRLLEIAFGQSLRTIAEEQVWRPLGLGAIRFGPLLPSPESCLKVAPTELDFHLHDFARGIVHDENARLFGGAAGHAGLFGSLRGVALFARHVLSAARDVPDSVLPASLIQPWTRRQPWLPGSSWGLGWDTPTPDGSAGPALGPSSFGHTGFTGTSIWIDPEKDLSVCILSNRVHPSRHGEGMKEARRQINTLAAMILG